MNNVYIIVHGSSCFPYTKECIQGFARYSNVIWSSWEDTPSDVLDKLAYYGIQSIIEKYPEEQGTSKLNWQRTGFLNGLKAAKLLGAKYVYKVRTDLEIPHLDFILSKLKYKCQNGGKQLNILCWDELSRGQCDWCMFGEINAMEEYWSFPNINCLSEREIPPQYFKLKSVPYNFCYDDFKKLIDTHIDLYIDNDIPINWLKDTKEDEHPITDHFSVTALYR